ncbi:hypothetical protein HYH02_004501 [Chlamydomonas schloesseri]|uniref:Uncharacterized protein n=1 Tax=Chlamydomonas schloesseri TaxID=2026947 RepID=A0A835WPK4_9CHLO|nr:hypothetical protein HYH02_004501 [Chlamydomonas schloesseri]|eukprot:KAG2450661.1 hypothetical protein HYH02_004501 [Chlamydomonas schloesseri]
MPQKPTLPSLAGRKFKKPPKEPPDGEGGTGLPAIRPSSAQTHAIDSSLPALATLPEDDAVLVDQLPPAPPPYVPRSTGRPPRVTYDGAGDYDIAKKWREGLGADSLSGTVDFTNGAWVMAAGSISTRTSTASSAASGHKRLSLPGQSSAGLGGSPLGPGGPQGSLDWRLAELRGILAQELGAGFPAVQWPPKSVPRRTVESIPIRTFRAELLALKAAGLNLTTLRYLLYSAPGALAVEGVVARLQALRRLSGSADEVETVDLWVRAPPLMTMSQEELGQRLESVEEALAREGRSAAFARDLVRLHPMVLVMRPEARDWRLGLLREVAGGAAVRSWRQELAGAAPMRLGALLTAPKRSLLRLKFTVERGSAPLGMAAIIRWSDAEWAARQPDFGAWEADYLAMEAAEAAREAERRIEWTLLPLT